MFSKLQRDERGFTIIEVLIVLAIAGLIMLIVFLAIPALQRSQRNNARNSDASRLMTAVGECLANRNGVTTSCMSINNVQVGKLDRLHEEPSFARSIDGAPTYSEDKAGVWYGHQCHEDGGLDNGNTIASSGSGSRSFVVVYQLESGIHRCING